MKNLSELTGTELVNVMNKVMAEVKSRLDEGTVTKYVAREIPSIVDGVDVVEHDGKLLRKVHRVCTVGDFVRVQHKNGDCFKPNKFYGPVLNGRVKADSSTGTHEYEKASVYNNAYGRDKSTVEVFEVVGTMEEVKKQLRIVSPSEYYFKQKSPNQQRAELIQRAGEFVEEKKDKYGRFYYSARKLCLNAEFIVNSAKRTVVCLLRGSATNIVYSRGIAKCMPGDVFNEWIGKAIALAKALQIDIPQEFMEAVQPDEVVEGMKLSYRNTNAELVTREVESVVGKRAYSVCGRTIGLTQAHSPGTLPTIIDDTSAEYEFESMGE